jgi:putative DNA primase/helicase
MAKETARRLYTQALSISDPNQRDEAERFARQSESARGIRAMLECARNEDGMSVSADDLDKDSMLLNCTNGTLDLRTMELRPHSSADLITKLCPVDLDLSAKCTQFDQFLREIFRGNTDLIDYVQRVIGYTLTGDVSEKVIFCFFGDGNNGKTTLLEAIRFMLGDYAGQVMIDSLLRAGSQQPSSAAFADLSDLKGARFVTTSEAEKGARLAEAQIKQLTGMGQVKSCRKYENPTTFMPTHKLFIDTNYRPIVKGRDAAIWGRLKLVPFDATIPDEKIDTGLLGKLRAEAQGILAWAIVGYATWRAFGLLEPPEVSASVNEWRGESDPFGGFFENSCEFKPGARCSVKDLWNAFTGFAKAEGLEMNRRDFADHLRRLGCTQDRTKNERFWLGIELRK